jgi:transcriptional regulator with XRE-family HTH domain
MDIRRVVGENVQRYRIEAGLSQAELAARMGASRAMSGAWKEAARIPLSSPFITWRKPWVFARPCCFELDPSESKPIAKRKAEKIFWQI